MPGLNTTRLLAGFLLVSPGCGERARDTGTVPGCDVGWLADRGECVPRACGSGPWGDLEVDENTVFVDVEAKDGGDGTADAPLGSIQAGLDLAAARGGGLVAVAAGTYAETLLMGAGHAGVELAGRCHELVVLDASGGEAGEPGIQLTLVSGEASLAGLWVKGAGGIGVNIDTGAVIASRIRVTGAAETGLEVGGSSLFASLTLEDSIVEDCHLFGLNSFGTSAEVAARDCVISGTLPGNSGEAGYGAQACLGGSLLLEACSIEECYASGVIAYHSGTELTMLDTVVRGGLEDADTARCGLELIDGPSATVEGCALLDSAWSGVNVSGEGTSLVMRDSAVIGTRRSLEEKYGWGLLVREGASMTAEACQVQRSSYGGVLVESGGVLTVSDSEISRNHYSGTCVHEGGTLSISDSHITDNESKGAHVSEGGSLRAVRCVYDSNSSIGVKVDGDGTEARLLDTRISNTLPDTDGQLGMGIEIVDDSTLEVRDCSLSGNRVAGVNAGLGAARIMVVDSVVELTGSQLSDGLGGYGLAIESGVIATLERCVVRGNQRPGIVVQGGGTLLADDCLVERNRGVGLSVGGASTYARLTRCLLGRTQPLADWEAELPGFYMGYGVTVGEGALVELVDCCVDLNTLIGVVADGEGTMVALEGTVIRGSMVNGMDFTGAAGMGVGAQKGAYVHARDSRFSSNKGPGAYVVAEDSALVCRDCEFVDNEYAGVLLDAGGATVELWDTLVSGTTSSANLGGGVGVSSRPIVGHETASLTMQGCTVIDNIVAGVWLSGEGAYRIENSHIAGGEGLEHGVTRRCGEAVYAGAGVAAWDDGAGLLLQDNVITGAQEVALLLDGASATLAGNSWLDNPLDLASQGEGCSQAPPGLASENIGETQLCPPWDYPVCNDYFSLNLVIADLPTPDVAARPPLPPTVVMPRWPMPPDSTRPDSGAWVDAVWEVGPTP